MSITGTPVDNGVNVAALLEAREALTAAPRRLSSNGEPLARGRTAPTATRPSKASLASAKSSTTSGSTPSTLIAPRSSPPRTTGRRRSSTCSSGSPAASPQASPPSPRTGRSSCARSRRPSKARSDVSGILGIDSDVRNGFSGIKVTYEIDADATPDEIKAIVAQSQKRSTVYDIITNPTNVTVEVR